MVSHRFQGRTEKGIQNCTTQENGGMLATEPCAVKLMRNA